ncbi:restriction endonuclease fold toxin-2 domain-containing protein [Kitasatospora aureofaciens]|uniref:restriction endonuclease fold toxin-2 domain-containing protein n=1 Tax=Kitasatospora aureofaciens TaxID=1894 RepID=UPI000B2DFD65|nr:restriction endonuclease fold toxin-2 domain-containing protein [Kitasatospora aureofaciens]
MDGGYKVDVKALVEGSWQLHQVSEDLLQTVTLLAGELSETGGMIGDDEAGEIFAKVYKPTAKTALNQMANACHFMGKGAETLLMNANAYLAAEDATAKHLLEASTDSSVDLSQPWAAPEKCAPDPRGVGESLPEAVGQTSGVDKWVWGDKYRGDAGKLRKAAQTWQAAHRLTAQVLSDAQDAWSAVAEIHEGETAKAIALFFGAFVGRQGYPAKPEDDHTLLANLSSACKQLGDACENYAKHIDDAASIFNGWFDAPWDNPIFGGNGDDGGLKSKVLGDTQILSLADTPHVLDDTQKRIPVPQGQPAPPKPSSPFPWILPFPAPLPVPGPLPLVPAVYTPVNPSVQLRNPVPPPVPPMPGYPPLTPTELAAFRQWKSGLVTGGFSGGNEADKRYQWDVAGYPEYRLPIVPLKPNQEPAMMADGLRETDGMIIEAKYVRDPAKCFRTLAEYEKSKNGEKGAKPKFLFKDDEEEMQKYAAAMNDPRNAQIRGMEIVTNDPNTVPYWRTMMALNGAKGYARYVPPGPLTAPTIS